MKIILILFCISMATAKISIIKTWNGVYSRGSKGVLAVRTSGFIESCHWTKVIQRSGSDVLRYSSKDREIDIKVKIEERKRLCKLFIDEVDEDEHGGTWEVTVYGKCKSRTKRQAPLLESQPVIPVQQPEVAQAGGVLSLLNPVVTKVKHTRTDVIRNRFKTAKASIDSRKEEECDVVDRAGGIVLEVVDDDALAIIAGQETVVGIEGTKVILTARTNVKIDKCFVQFDREEIELTKGKADCDNNFHGIGRVCLENYESKADGIYACNVRIYSMDSKFIGKWNIRVEKEDSRRTMDKDVDIELTMTGLPRSVTIYDENDDDISSRDGTDIESGRREFEIQCAASGRDLDGLVMKLYAGDKHIQENEASNCRLDDYCTRFIFTPRKYMDNEVLSCVAYIQDYDSFSNRKLMATAGKFQIDRYGASLINYPGDSIRVCAKNKQRGDKLDVEIEFEADPEPKTVEWKMQELVGDQATIEAGDDFAQYEAYTIEDAGRGKYIASLAIDNLEDNDLDIPNNHQLIIDNGMGAVTINITFQTNYCSGSSSERLEKYQCNPRDRDCRCDSSRSSRKCCDASSRCEGENCCERCRSSDSSRTCKYCDDDGENCMKLTQEEKYQCDPSDRDCRCDSTRSSRECCDASSRCDGDNCCERCRSSDSSRTCKYCDDDQDNCMKLKDADEEEYQCDLDDRDCRCDSSRSSRECCDASSRCEGKNCCTRCRSSDSSRVCKYCDEDKENCMKIDNDENEEYQCDLDDRDCRCDSSRSSRKCCDASSRCEGENCCERCRSSDSSRTCKYCDDDSENCMKLKDADDEEYQCDLDDRDCRCDSSRSSRKCCDASSRCEGENCCERCRSSDSSRTCKYCDDDSENCMKLKEKEDLEEYQCDLDDRDCRCDSSRSSRKCCDASSRCEGENCCTRCRSSDSSRVCKYCDEDDKNCMKLENEDKYQCDLDDRDCRCDSSRSSRECCDASSRCEGDNCCKDCRSSDSSRVCKFCDDDGNKCMKLESNDDDNNEKQCDRDDRDCFCFKDVDYCCSTDRDCRGNNCCNTCDREDDNCECESSRNCFQLPERYTQDSNIKGKASKILLESCLKMSSSLLEVWQPNGDKRPSSQSEREFKENLEDFFTTAKCTKFDDDIQDYVDGKRKNSPLFQNQKVETVFLSGLNKVNKVNEAINKKPSVQVLQQAKKIIEEGKNLS